MNLTPKLQNPEPRFSSWSNNINKICNKILFKNYIWYGMGPKMYNSYHQKEESNFRDDASINQQIASRSWYLIYGHGNVFMSELWFTF